MQRHHRSVGQHESMLHVQLENPMLSRWKTTVGFEYDVNRCEPVAILIHDLRADLEQEEREMHLLMEEGRRQEAQLQADRSNMERSRRGMAPAKEGSGDAS